MTSTCYVFFSSGTSWKELGGETSRGAAASVGSDDGSSTGGVDSEDRERNYVMERRDKGSDIVLVASEPLTFERGMLTFSPLSSFSICLFYPKCEIKANKVYKNR